MHKLSKVSILIPTYNAGRFLIESIRSCLDQDYKNIEICIVNDGSTDNSFENAKLCFEENNIKWFSYKKNKGKIFALNKAFEMAEGEYIVLHAADDVMKQKKVSSLIKNIGEYSFLVSDVDITDENLKIQKTRILNKHYNSKKNIILIKTECLLVNPYILGGSISPRSIAEKIFPLPHDLPHEDWWIPLISSLYGSIAILNSPLMFYRMHKGNTSEVNKTKTSIKKEIWAFIRHEEYYKNILNLKEIDNYKNEKYVNEIKYQLILNVKYNIPSKNIDIYKIKSHYKIIVYKYYIRYLYINYLQEKFDEKCIRNRFFHLIASIIAKELYEELLNQNNDKNCKMDKMPIRRILSVIKIIRRIFFL